ncbi:ribonuclease Z [Nematocida ausubeli]|nr:ribonuclease Z [Nematocida ausubeli]
MYQIAINSTEGGTSLNIVNKTTGEYLAIGGFEGMQRYMGRKKIKLAKLRVICICSKYEIVPAISAVLTTAMHEGKIHTRYVCAEDTEKLIQEVGMGIGNLEFFDKYDNSSKDRFADLQMEELHNVAYVTVALPNKKASFSVEKASEKGIVGKADIAMLNKTGKIVKDGIEYLVDQFRNKAVCYPKIAVITILSDKYAVDVKRIQTLMAGGSGVEIFIRAAPELFSSTKEEHKLLAEVEREIKKKIASEITDWEKVNINLYIMMRSETEAEPVKKFYDKVCPVYTPLIRPLIYTPKNTKYLRNSKVVIDQTLIEYAGGDEVQIHNAWKRDKDSKEIEDKQDIVQADCQTEIESTCSVFLGTAAAVPGVIRNVSSVLVASMQGSILLDCGEDTGTQLNKISAHYRYNYAAISMIVLTHRHADHIMGMFSVLRRCNVAGNTAVLVLGNKCIVSALKEFGISGIFVQNSADLEVSIHRKESIEYIVMTNQKESVVIRISQNIYRDCKSISPLNYRSHNGVKRSVLSVFASNEASFVKFINLPVKIDPSIACAPSESSIYKVSMCSALHIHESYSVLVKETAGSAEYTVAYSGDTKPNEKFSDLSQHADLMIHEGTFEENELVQARMTQHSTISQAMAVFQSSRAQTLFITHISQRYKTVTIPDGAYLAMDYLVHIPGTNYKQTALYQALKEWAEDKE